MNSERIEKIKKLVQTSSIFTPAERTEWVSLLDLMNDKQILELERILSAGAESEEQKLRSYGPTVNANGPSQNPLSPPSTVQPPVRPLNLSHILNIPKAENPSADHPLELKKPLLARQPVKESNSFASRLKNIILEKELATSRPEYPTELEDGYNTQQKKPLIVPLPPKKPNVIPPARLPLGAPILKTAPVNKIPSSTVPAQSVHFPMAKPPRIQNQGALQKEVPQNSPHEPNAQDLRNQTAHAVPQKLKPTENIKVGLEKWPELKSLGEHKRPAVLAKERPKAENVNPVTGKPGLGMAPDTGFTMPLAQKVSYKKPEELTALTAKELRSVDIQVLVSGVKNLIKEFGYHNIIFNLEQSPLYKIYINTGTQLLAQDSNFEGLVNKNPVDFLSKSEFEKFTDLLMQIKAS